MGKYLIQPPKIVNKYTFIKHQETEINQFLEAEQIKDCSSLFWKQSLETFIDNFGTLRW